MVPHFVTVMPFNIGSSKVTATNGWLWGPWRLALSVEQLTDDQPELGTAVLQACFSTSSLPTGLAGGGR